MNNLIDAAATNTSIATEIILSGPSVVLQGMRDDGMEKIIDTIPILVEHSADDQSRVSSHGTHDPALTNIPSSTGEGTSSDTDVYDEQN